MAPRKPAPAPLFVLLLILPVLLVGCTTPAPPPNGGQPNQTPDNGTGSNGTPGPLLPPAAAADPAVLMGLVEDQVYVDGDQQTPRYRTPGTDGHAATVPLLRGMLEARGLQVSLERFQVEVSRLGEVNATNVYGVREGTTDEEIWLAAHWDSRAWADGEPEHDTCTGPPVLGANDGAAAVAVVVHALDLLGSTNHTIRVALFDVEDQGCGGSDWALGSAWAAEHLPEENRSRIRALLLVDMPGAKDLEIRREGNSMDQAPWLTDLVFDTASRMQAPAFLDQPGASILDDHVAFLERGVPAVDIIHLDDDDRRGVFPWTHHTTEDTPENLSGENMAQVTDVVVTTVLRLDRGEGR